MQSFPAFASAAATATTSVDSAADEQQQPQLSSETTVNANEALRGALARLAHTGQSLDALPDGECTFTLAVELRDSAEAPIRVRFHMSDGGKEKRKGQKGKKKKRRHG